MQFKVWVNPRQQVVATSDEMPECEDHRYVYENTGGKSVLDLSGLDDMELADELHQRDFAPVGSIEIDQHGTALKRGLDNLAEDFRQSLKLLDTVPQVGELVGGVVRQMIEGYRQFAPVSTVVPPLPDITLLVGAAAVSRYEFWEVRP